jgi:hypothetical protein
MNIATVILGCLKSASFRVETFSERYVILYKRLYKPLFSIFQEQRYKFFAYIHTVRKNRNRKSIDCCGFSQKAVIVAKLFETMEKRSKVKNFAHFHVVAQCLFPPA